MLIKAVLFDLDNTLHVEEPCHQAGLEAVFQAVEPDFKLDRAEFFKRYHEARVVVGKRLLTQAAGRSQLLYFQYFFEQLEGRTLIAESLTASGIYWDAYMEAMILRPGILEALRLLKKCGVVCVLVSDMLSELQMEKLLRLELQDYFAFVVTSEESGADQPSPQSIQLALDKLQIKNPEGVIFVGDAHDRNATAADHFDLSFVKVVSDQDSQNLTATLQHFLGR